MVEVDLKKADPEGLRMRWRNRYSIEEDKRVAIGHVLVDDWGRKLVCNCTYNFLISTFGINKYTLDMCARVALGRVLKKINKYGTMNVSFSVDHETATLARELEESVEIRFKEPVIVRKSPHSFPVKIMSIIVSNTDDTMHFYFKCDGPAVIDVDMCDKMSQSVNQRLKLLKSQKK